MEQEHTEMIKQKDDDRKTCNPDSPLIEKRQNILIFKYLKTQVGSKEYQKMIKTMNKQQIDNLIDELDYSIGALIQNEFGNYFVQTLFSICDYDQRVIVIHNIRHYICDLVSSQEGTFTLQQFINHMSVP